MFTQLEAGDTSVRGGISHSPLYSELEGKPASRQEWPGVRSPLVNSKTKTIPSGLTQLEHGTDSHLGNNLLSDPVAFSQSVCSYNRYDLRGAVRIST